MMMASYELNGMRLDSVTRGAHAVALGSQTGLVRKYGGLVGSPLTPTDDVLLVQLP